MNDERQPAHTSANSCEQTHECQMPGCSTLIPPGRRYCAKHRPSADWAISEQVLADIEAEAGG